eukprot:5129483-Amphidinium_carterae.1
MPGRTSQDATHFEGQTPPMQALQGELHLEVALNVSQHIPLSGSLMDNSCTIRAPMTTSR